MPVYQLSDDTFEQNVAKLLDGCWVWLGQRDPNGYGQVTLPDGHLRAAHRVTLEMFLGREIRPGLCSCHRCDVRLCVRPEHLWEGSRSQNTRDRDAKGRQAFGERNAAAVLTEDAVREIRQTRDRSEPVQALADRYGVSKSAMEKVIYGDSWKHLH